jgi:hypothetical protein
LAGVFTERPLIQITSWSLFGLTITPLCLPLSGGQSSARVYLCMVTVPMWFAWTGSKLPRNNLNGYTVALHGLKGSMLIVFFLVP